MPAKKIKAKQPDPSKDISFSLVQAESGGGKTGSVRAKVYGDFYQYKPSIREKFVLSTRRRKAGGLDSENFGEVLAARIAKAFDKDGDKPRVPEVSFVTDPESPHVAIVSKYLTGDKVSTLDDYFKIPKGRHVKLVSGADDPQKGHYNINDEKIKPLKKELAGAIALSALVGDHDVNPGNMMVLEGSDGSMRLGRIDYGHAFKDLMRFSSFGGQTVHSNNIIDFFNRGTVDGLGANAKAKLFRDYPGLIPSREMADALKDLANQEGASAKIKAAINEVRDEIKQILQDPTIDKQQVIASFQRIAEHVSGEKINRKLRGC